MLNPVGPIYVLLSLFLWWLAYLAVADRIPRNGTVGMRTEATKASDAAWFAAQRASAWSLVAMGLVFGVTGVWITARQPEDGIVAKLVMGSALVVVVIAVAGGLHADSVARAVARR